MSYERVKEHLGKFGLEDRIRLFEVSSATVALAAEALGTEEARIAKTLSFLTPEGTILVVAAGDAKIDNRKFKDTFRAKAKMLSHDEVEALVGHAVGGVCPFGINPGVKVFLDGSLRRFDIVYPAAGTASSAVELSVSELEIASAPNAWVDVTQIPSANEE
jgi:prolyl-tRNA editing enzyme YbaK/EbsC (Cys-tRNA(Pro) deacylase)